MKVGIITINDFNNYGNRLQNYAVEKKIKELDIECVTIRNNEYFNNKDIKTYIIYFWRQFKALFKNNKEKSYVFLDNRKNNFAEFNKNILFSKRYFTAYSKIKGYDFFITGSDQVWNPTFERLSDMDLLSFSEPQKRIAFSASFGINELPDRYKEKTKKELLEFKAISVREYDGKKIVEQLIDRCDVEVLIDPTMLLTVDEWDKVCKKPKMLKTDRYILNYYLGNLSESRRNEIERIAQENNCEIIDILDKDSEFYECGPSEFLYLEKHAFLICTDSFHSSVFALLYNRPFIVFNRDQEGVVSMNSRIDTLISKFKLKDREYNEKRITMENLKHDYTEAYKILQIERDRSLRFLKKALELESD